MRVRLATPNDAEELARLRYAFRAASDRTVEGEVEFIGRCAPWMAERLMGESAWRCWVVQDGEQIAGHLWLCLLEKIPNPARELERHGYITNVFVVEEARGSGAGRALMERALEYCRAQGVDSVILWPTDRSRTLYARHGFGEPDDMMEAILDAGRDLHALG